MIDIFVIAQNECIPRGMGVAWRLYDRDASVVLPIPINILARVVRRTWMWVKCPLAPPFDVGYREGYIDGLRDATERDHDGEA